MSTSRKDIQEMGTIIDSVSGQGIELITADDPRADQTPGLGWQLTPETEKALDEIDNSLRAAARTVGRKLVA